MALVSLARAQAPARVGSLVDACDPGARWVEHIELPPRQQREYVRPPKSIERLVPFRYAVSSK